MWRITPGLQRSCEADALLSRRRAPNGRSRLIVVTLLAGGGLYGTSPPPHPRLETLEWATRTSELIVIGRPIRVDPDVVRTDDSRFEEEVTIKVERVLTGTFSGSELTYRWKPTRRTPYMKYWLEREEGTRCQLGLSHVVLSELGRALIQSGQSEFSALGASRAL
jgi:hypothetical protein